MRRRRLRQHPPPRRRRRHRRPKLIETERGGGRRGGRAGEEIEPPLWLWILACRRCLHMHATETGLTREAGTGRR
jgi:hypothetical protein